MDWDLYAGRLEVNQAGEPYLAETIVVSAESDAQEPYGRIWDNVVLYGKDPRAGFPTGPVHWDVWRFDLVERDSVPLLTDPEVYEFVGGFDKDLIALDYVDAHGTYRFELYLYDLARAERSPLLARATGADVSQGVLVYIDNESELVFGYDAETGDRFQISSAGNRAFGEEFTSPRISGDWVVWQRCGDPFDAPLYANKILPRGPILRVVSSPSCSPGRASVILRSPWPAEGFSFGLAHEPGVIPVKVEQGSAVKALRGGAGADFWAASLRAAGDGREGVTVGMIGSKANPASATLPANVDLEVAVITYRAPGAEFGPVESVLEFVDVLNPKPNTEPTRCVVTCEGQSKLPRKEAGVLRVEGVCFARGNCNCDENLMDISDAIFLLSYLFVTEERVPCCERACDADDSGDLDITDAIGILNRLFLGADPLPPPYGECGLDPTPDALRCPEFPPCEP